MVQLFNNPESIELFWQGIIIERLLSSLMFKRRIHELLKSLNLPKNINLREFYEASPQKWLLTFTAVDITSKKIIFINK